MMMDNSGWIRINYLDIRNENHYQDQAPYGWTHIREQRTVFARYSGGAERGSRQATGRPTTENLPGLANFTISPTAVGSWNHVFSSTKLNTISLAFSRLPGPTSQNNGVNDIVGQLV